MSKQTHRYQRRRVFRSYFGIVFSVSLILFVVGVLSLLVLNARQVSQHVKEQVVLTIFIDDNAKEVEVNQLETMLKLAAFTRSVTYISKEQAATEHSADIGEDFMDFLGYNPLKDAIDLRLKGEYVTTHRVDSISAFLAEKPFVSELVFDRPLVNLLNENIERARLLLLACCLFFLALSIILIHNSIRLSIYAKRMIIKTMQLVGARKRFIRGPFIRTYLLLGMVSALISCLGVWALVINAQTYLPGIDLLMNPQTLLISFIGVFLLSMLISSVSARWATQRYLNLKTQSLY
ncbi:MAG: permease-like cell division protein FtsX [Flavobacteriaceae bacterium]|nr:permease-like cell division protein FtsX [Flavobacteriaceae bacterium]